MYNSEFNQDTSRVKNAAFEGSVVITDRSIPAHALSELRKIAAAKADKKLLNGLILSSLQNYICQPLPFKKLNLKSCY
jgi:hypothetical protein